MERLARRLPSHRRALLPGLSPQARMRLWLVGASAAGWTLLALIPSHWWPPPLCLSPEASAPTRYWAEWRTFLASPVFAGTLLHWSVMLVAMMLPLIGSPLLQIEMQVFARRRAAAKLLFASAYFLAWSAALSAALAVLLALRGAGAAAWAAEPLLFVAAAAWQGTHLKRRALQACHRPGRFRAGGAGANADMRRFGLQHGAACIAACWTVMLPMLLGEHGLLPGLAATLVLFAERHEMRPQIRASQVILLLLALLTALPA